MTHPFQAEEPESNEAGPEPGRETKSSSKSLIAGLIVVGLAMLVVTSMTAGNKGRDESYMVGYVVGAMVFLPAIIMGICAIFKGMRNQRSQLIVLLTVWSLSLLGSFSDLSRSFDQVSDQEVLEAANARSAELKRQLLETDDPREMARIQAELADVLDGMETDLSVSEQGTMEALNSFLKPLFELSQAYSIKMADLSESPKSDYTTIESKEDIAGRIAVLEEAAGMVERILATFETVEADLKEHLKSYGMSEYKLNATLRDFMAGFGKQQSLVLETQNYELRILRNLQSSLRYLDEHWGRWAVDDDGLLEFEDEIYDGYLSLVDELETLSAEQEVVRRQLLSGEG